MKKNVLYSLLLLLLVSFTVKAEDNVAKGKIVGKVVDKANNEPIIGLVVMIDGTTTGTQTNFDGQYELLNLKPNDIDSKRNVVIIRQSKGKKDRITPLSPKILELLRNYYKEYSPKTYLFEGQKKNTQYSARSLEEILKKSIKLVTIN